MRILCVIDDVPRPETSGYKIRLANVVRALASVGDVDLFVRVPHDFDLVEGIVPAGVGVRRSFVVHGDTPRSTPKVVLSWLLGRLPRGLIRMRSEAAREALRRWAQPPYDLVWFGHAHSYARFADLVDGSVMVDLDNLEDQHIRHHREVRAADRRRGASDRIRSRPRQLVASFFDRVDEHRWRKLQQRIVDRAEVVMLCSELDRGRLNAPNCVVLPNGYELSSSSAGRQRRPLDPDSPVFLMVGLLTYEPNADAAWFFADEVLPALRRDFPGAQLQLVGRYDWQVEALSDRPGLVLRGEVEDLSAHLPAADVAVIPIRFGGGTRIKALEAFAWRLPLVSTTVGVEGIPAVPGVHYLRADTPEEFVEACRRLVADSELRRSLGEAGHALWAEHFRWTDIRASLEKLVADTISAPIEPRTL